MIFRFYTDTISRASRSAAAVMLIVGLLLIGFGVVIAALPEVFAYLAAVVFFVVGAGCGITAIKIFIAQKQIDKLSDEQSGQVYRTNVRIHTEEHYDL